MYRQIGLLKKFLGKPSINLTITCISGIKVDFLAKASQDQSAEITVQSKIFTYSIGFPESLYKSDLHIANFGIPQFESF